jgi:hypothetical protein
MPAVITVWGCSAAGATPGQQVARGVHLGLHPETADLCAFTLIVTRLIAETRCNVRGSRSVYTVRWFFVAVSTASHPTWRTDRSHLQRDEVHQQDRLILGGRQGRTARTTGISFSQRRLLDICDFLLYNLFRKGSNYFMETNQ